LPRRAAASPALEPGRSAWPPRRCRPSPGAPLPRQPPRIGLGRSNPHPSSSTGQLRRPSPAARSPWPSGVTLQGLYCYRVFLINRGHILNIENLL
jgi:hypothetical protein